MKPILLLALASFVLASLAQAQTPRSQSDPRPSSAATAPTDTVRAERASPDTLATVQERTIRIAVQAGLLSTTFAGGGATDLGRKGGLHLAVAGQYDLDERPYFGRIGASFDQFGAGERDYRSGGDFFRTAAARAAGTSRQRRFYGDSADYFRLRLLGGRRWLVTDREWPLRAGVGPDVGVLVGTNVDGFDQPSPMRTLDVGLAALVELGIPATVLSTLGEVTVGLDYTHGLTSAADPGAYGGARQNRAIGLKVGFLTRGRSEARPADRR